MFFNSKIYLIRSYMIKNESIIDVLNEEVGKKCRLKAHLRGVLKYHLYLKRAIALILNLTDQFLFCATSVKYLIQRRCSGGNEHLVWKEVNWSRLIFLDIWVLKWR